MASIKRNFFYNILLNLSGVIFPIITAPYVARVLDPDGLGLAGFANVYAGYFAMFAALGSGRYTVREIAKVRDSKEQIQNFVSEITALLGINTLICAALYIISIFVFPKFSSDWLIFLIAGLAIYILPLKIDWYFIGLEKVGVIVSRALIIRIISIICLFLFVKSKADLYIYVLLGFISSFGGVAWNLWMLRKDKIKLSWKFSGIGKHYKPMFILFSSAIAISIYVMLDSFMLGLMADYSEVGYYNSSTTLSKTLLNIVTSLSAVAVPRVAYYLHKKEYTNINSLIAKSLGIVAFLAFPMTIGLMCIAPRFIPLFLGEQFIPSILPTILMASVIVAIGFSNITGTQILIGMGKDVVFLYSMLWGTVSNFLLNLILIPKLGATGAATASVIAEFLVLGASFYYVKKETEVKFTGVFREIWVPFVACLPFIPITLIINHFTQGWWSIITVVLSCVLCYIFMQKLFKTKSYCMMWDLVASRITKITDKFSK
ncbi:MAG: flippase [Muribaculaceae bacterium]|nr:flippase [Muribaculaceae bacterium]